MSKPELEHASGISPTIAIEQKSAGNNPRSTVGTLTEIYDHLRVLYARVAIPHCPISGEAVSPQSRERIIKVIQHFPEKSRIQILAPYARERKGEYKEEFQEWLRKGFMRARIDGKVVNLEDPIALDRNLVHDLDIVIDRLVVEPANYSRIAESVTTALEFGQGLCLVIHGEDEEQLFSMHAYSPRSGISYSSLEPHDFSFNSPSGMCPLCHGLGVYQEFDLEKIIDPDLSIAAGCCSIGSDYQTVKYGNIYDNLARIYQFSVDTPWKKLSESAKKVFLYGTEKKWTRIHFVHPVTGATWTDNVIWKGVLYEAKQRLSEAKSTLYRQKIYKLMHEQCCPECKGSRLKPYPSSAELQGRRIYEVTGMTVAEAEQFFQSLRLGEEEALIADDLLKEIRQRLRFLAEVGLHYLTLDRTAPTLSGGEVQRVRLASQIGCGLVGITYVLDEPSIGLHPRDNKKLIETLKHLRDRGNTVVVVEHDEETIWEADQIVDFGPGAGNKGGQVLVSGSLLDLLENHDSITGKYLRGDLSIPVPKKRRKLRKEHLLIKGATHHNLKNISVKIPLGVFVAITGVSGSGKSSLITEILYPTLSNHLHKTEHPVGAHDKIQGLEYLDKVIAIDQTPIGRNPRSNPATYIKLLDEIRDLFTMLPESQARGYKPGRFSFNVKEGSCSECEGMGMVKIDMDFMEAAWIECSLCKGKRFDQDTLEVFYKGKNIYDILEMEVGEALEFFANIPAIRHKLETLQQVGMEYIKLGQSSTTLSGGEAQRVKLAKELTRPSTGKTLYILDEPTTGLHFHDIQRLLEILNALVARGNSIVVIEHNMDVVKAADWILDLGPEGGTFGGELVAQGTPEQIAKLNTPTGVAVKDVLSHEMRKAFVEAHQQQVQVRQERVSRKGEELRQIVVEGASQNNLKDLTLTIPREKITVCTGPSGSGKSSLAFDTVYAEGQRRYIESLSPYARQFVKQMPKPKVGYIEGLSPAIAIEQKAHAGNPRSTIGTMTEIYDYLRVLYARIGTPHCPETGEEIKSISKEYVMERILSYPEGEKIQILAPQEQRRSDSFEGVIERLQKQGFIRIRLNGHYFDLDQDKETIAFDRKRKNELYLVIDRLRINEGIRHRLNEAVELAIKMGNGRLLIAREGKDDFFNLAFAAESSGKSYPAITPHTFAFNTTEGMCLDCQGLGFQYGANLAQNRQIMELSSTGLVHFLWKERATRGALSLFKSFLEAEAIDPSSLLNELPPDKLQLLLEGGVQEKWYYTQGVRFRWVGVNAVLAKLGRHGQAELRETLLPSLEASNCSACKGARINPLARHVTIKGVSIQQLCSWTIEQTQVFIEELRIPQGQGRLLEEVMTQLKSRLHFLCDVGLHYMALERRAPTLSGGEAQRIRLARQLGNGLTGVLYVLDEPTIGLHPHDNARLNHTLIRLNQLGNTLILVEHDPMTLEIADYILDFGPQAGQHGGHLVAAGTVKQIMRNPKSLTGKYLSGKMEVPMPLTRRPLNQGTIQMRDVTFRNLKNVTVDLYVGVLNCLTGVSGSGKSTLIYEVLLPAVTQGLLSRDQVVLPSGYVSGISHFDRLISIDQNPIGHTIRSDVGTYVEVFTRLREFFSQLPLAKVHGLLPQHFSYNHRKGMCSHCWGLGYRRIDMQFLPEVKVMCEACKGLRLNPLSLEVVYAGKNLGEYLNTTIDEIRAIFANHPRIIRILDTVISVGLGYLKLGQEMATLSGGEAQRIKLSRELAKRSSGKTLYLLDEPTTGLHPDDIKKLLSVIHKLVDKGNTMVVIEHQLDVIKNADFIVDLGPEAGEQGGEVVCSGTPETVSEDSRSRTGQYLRRVLR